MIILTLAGNSSRFFDSGYVDVKYKLKFGDVCVIQAILNYIPTSNKILIVLNKKYNDRSFFESILEQLGFKNFLIVEINNSMGQLDTLYLGLKQAGDFISIEESVTVFNGDTIRKSFEWNFSGADGFIEVFQDSGTHWSFVDQLGIVTKVTEKNRISNYCSTGLYHFKSASIILSNFILYSDNKKEEMYIAPFYNFLINKGAQILSFEINKDLLLFCGTPSEYEFSLSLIKK